MAGINRLSHDRQVTPPSIWVTKQQREHWVLSSMENLSLILRNEYASFVLTVISPARIPLQSLKRTLATQAHLFTHWCLLEYSCLTCKRRISSEMDIQIQEFPAHCFWENLMSSWDEILVWNSHSSRKSYPALGGCSRKSWFLTHNFRYLWTQGDVHFLSRTDPRPRSMSDLPDRTVRPRILSRFKVVGWNEFPYTTAQPYC